MKYLGPIQNNKDLVNKQYVDKNCLQASVDDTLTHFNGRVFQWVGATDSIFTNGHFYKWNSASNSYDAIDTCKSLRGTTTTDVGKLPAGTDITGWSLEKTLSSILMDDTPLVAITAPGITLYEAGTTLSDLLVRMVATKAATAITEIRLYVDSTLETTITSGVSEGGTFEHTLSSDITSDTTLRAEVSNTAGLSSGVDLNLKFVSSTYYGTSGANPSVSDIKAGAKILLSTKGYTATFNIANERVFFAYPSAFGDLNAITDVQNNLSLLDTFTKSTITIDGVSYNLYVLDEDTTGMNFSIRFD